MALYHNLSCCPCSKNNSVRRAENSSFWASPLPSLFFFHMLLPHPFKHLCSGCTKKQKREGEKTATAGESLMAALGSLPVSPRCGDSLAASPANTAPCGFSHCRASTMSRHTQQLHTALLTSAPPAGKQLLVVFRAAFQGWFFFFFPLGKL